MREKKIERTMLENGEEMIVFNSFFFTKIIIPTKIDRDSEREREREERKRVREGKEQMIDGQRQTQR